jgi:hypothetical protein
MVLEDLKFLDSEKNKGKALITSTIIIKMILLINILAE